MMSRTIRVFKLMYIVAGILISNEEICETVDRIQIAPRVEVKPEIDSKQLRALTAAKSATGQPATATQSKAAIRRRRISISSMLQSLSASITRRFSWLRKYDVRMLLQHWCLISQGFNKWTIPNYLLECTSSYMSKRFLINSDCDMIYK